MSPLGKLTKGVWHLCVMCDIYVLKKYGHFWEDMQKIGVGMGKGRLHFSLDILLVFSWFVYHVHTILFCC